MLLSGEEGLSRVWRETDGEGAPRGQWQWQWQGYALTVRAVQCGVSFMSRRRAVTGSLRNTVAVDAVLPA